MHLKKVAPLLAIGAGTLMVQAAEPLKSSVYTSDEHSFNVNSTLITGPKEAVVIGAGFTRADAYRIAAAVLDSGKNLKAVLISDADPDYYFGAEVLHAIFPRADIVATAPVVQEITEKLHAKLAFWGPQLGANAPVDPVLPKALVGTTLTVDGEAIEVRGVSGELANRPWVWIPSLREITGNVAIFGQLHVWTADTQTPAKRQAWLSQLDEMLRLKPAVVVPGHMKPGSALDDSSIRYTHEYLATFIEQSAKADSSTVLIEEMRKRYPDVGLGIALDLGAKVAKGEMKW
jgi:glyoxylase-like metal-dependent hydrolase (beta-lactamase superfamily II)